MYSNEILDLIDHVDTSRDLFDLDKTAILENSTWKIYSFLIKRQLEGKIVTQSNLALASGLPRATGIRKILQLIKEEKIVKKPRTKTGKSFSLHPSILLEDSFYDFLKKTKYHLAYAMGYSSRKSKKFYFGSSLLSANIISPPSNMEINSKDKKQINILAKNNPTFLVMKKNKSFIEKLLDIKLNIKLLDNDELRMQIIKNSKKKISHFDLVAFNFPWTSEIHSNQLLMPIKEFVFQDNFNIKDFHTGSIQASIVEGQLYGLPIEEVASIMVYRKDIFQKHKINVPLNIRQLFIAIKKIKQINCMKNPISWPVGRGFPIGSSFIEMMGNLGQPVLNLRQLSKGHFDLSNLNNSLPRFKIYSAAGIDSLNIINKLLKYSPQDSLFMSWDDVANSYAKGEVAIANIWSGRACFFEYDKFSPAYQNSIYTEKLGGNEGMSVSTIGGYSLGIPSNVQNNDINTIIKVLKYLVSPNMIKFFITKGVTASPLFSVSNDPEVQDLSSSIVAVDEMQKKGLIKNWIRAPFKHFYEIIDYIGIRIHEALSNNIAKAEFPPLLKNIQEEVENTYELKNK